MSRLQLNCFPGFCKSSVKITKHCFLLIFIKYLFNTYYVQDTALFSMTVIYQVFAFIIKLSIPVGVWEERVTSFISEVKESFLQTPILVPILGECGSVNV